MKKWIESAWQKAKSPAQHTALQRFQWVGTRQNGRIARGTLTARTTLLARAQMRREGIVCSEITPIAHQRSHHLPLEKSTAFAKKMATLLNASLSLPQAFDALCKAETDKPMKALIEDIQYTVEQGHTFSQALQKHPHCFSRFFCQMVHAGEQSARLGVMLSRIVTYQTQLTSIRNTVKKALVYPLMVLITAIVVTGILLITVIPSFQSLFDGLGAPLPWLTRQVVNLAHITQRFGLTLLSAHLIVFLVIRHLKKHHPAFSDPLERLKLNIPMVGALIQKAMVARFASTLSLLFASGMPLIEGLTTVSTTFNHPTYSKACERITQQVSLGVPLHQAMKETRCFPPLLLQMTAVGEACGQLSEMLQQAATVYEHELNDAMDAFSHLLEPLIMALLGVFIGGLVIAMYLPVFQLGATF